MRHPHTTTPQARPFTPSSPYRAVTDPKPAVSPAARKRVGGRAAVAGSLARTPRPSVTVWDHDRDVWR